MVVPIRLRRTALGAPSSRKLRTYFDAGRFRTGDPPARPALSGRKVVTHA